MALERPVPPSALDVESIDVLDLTCKPFLAFTQSAILSASEILIALFRCFPFPVCTDLLPVFLTGDLRAARN